MKLKGGFRRLGTPSQGGGAPASKAGRGSRGAEGLGHHQVAAGAQRSGPARPGPRSASGPAAPRSQRVRPGAGEPPGLAP